MNVYQVHDCININFECDTINCLLYININPLSPSWAHKSLLCEE